MNKVGEAFLSGFITVLLERFISAETYNLVVGKKLGPELVRRLKTALLAAEALVADAEQKQFGNQFVRKWLDDLRDAVYKADDLLDRFCIKAATQKQVGTFLPSFLNFEERQMVNEIEEVVRTIEDLERCKESLGLEKIPSDSSSWRVPSTSLARGNVYGREDDQKALVQMLNDNKEHHLSVISIVGIGGVGKTTLAQWLYNNEGEFMKEFDLKAWVCVSEKFEVVETTRNVIKQIHGGTCSLDDFNSLQNALKEELSNKKFFIVLDDVWSNDQHKWRNFITPFQYGAKGSTILLTTRKENVGLVAQTNYQPLILNTLSEDQCWSVFASSASFPESNGSPALEEIGKKIAKKCDGLPLAAETLGSLCRNHDAEEWGEILKSDIWEFSTNDSKIIPALLISYYHLPPYLKRCFVYCSLFPKGHQLEKDELILLWMAEDLLRVSNRRETLEEVGSKYFDDLASRLFFKEHQKSDYYPRYIASSIYFFKELQKSDYYPQYFVMHDLLHDLAIFLAGDFYCRLSELGEEEELGSLTRHLSFGKLNRSVLKNVNSIATFESLRTSLYVNDLFSMESVASKLKYLRVLSFDELDVVPNSIGELIHLRYLDLSRTDIKTLPESLCSLCNLQTLKLYYCRKLATLPSGLHNLVSLRHLDIRRTSLEEMPGKMSKLNQLHILSSFVVGKHENNGIQELGGLVNLHGSVEIKKLENIVDVNEAKRAKIMDKKHIDELCLEWSSGDDLVSSTQKERDMLDKLQPQNGLKELKINGYKGTIFPDWLGNWSYQNMTSVSLKSCKNCCMLPSLGQLPSLKSLSIEGLDQLRSIGEEFYKNEGDHHSSHIAPFPSLEKLKFDDMACWEVWHVSESETFPQLRRLEIIDCGMLKEEMLNQVFFRIVSSLSDVSKVRKLHIDNCFIQPPTEAMYLDGDSLSVWGCESVRESALKAMMSMNHLNCLQEMDISWCSSHVSFPGNYFPKSLQKLKLCHCSKLEFPHLQQQKYDLVELIIGESCDSLTSLSLDVFPNLKNLWIRECRNLESVSMSEAPHAVLQHVSIYDCPELVSFAGEGLAAPNFTHLEIRRCRNLESVSMSEAPHAALQSLSITYCYKLVSFAGGGLAAPNLTHLTIYSCDKLVSFAGEGLAAPNLTHLEISGCENLESVSMSEATHAALQRLSIQFYHKLEFPQLQQHMYDLVELEMKYCDSLTSLSLDVFPNLKNLEIRGCRNLESVSMSEAPHAALQSLSITYCYKLVSFAGEGLAAPNLTHLQVGSCSKLEALPRDMKSLLPSLQSLKIYGCPNICRLAEGGLPPNLKELIAGGSEQQMRDLSWMANLHALTHLTIDGLGCKNIKSYPEVGSLPHLPSLTTLHIEHFDNLETLECNELLRLTSLQQLHIYWCQKLENMEGEKLPPSLLLLKIQYSGLLGEHCKNKHQLIWPKISHIPTIQVDFKQIV